MKLPKTLAGWCKILFFLAFGINSFVALPFGAFIIGALALGAGIFMLLDK